MLTGYGYLLRLSSTFGAWDQQGIVELQIGYPHIKLARKVQDTDDACRKFLDNTAVLFHL